MADGFGARVRRAIEGLTPGHFALVMATGIISVGMHLEGFDLLSNVLLALCATAFVVLLALTAVYRLPVVEAVGRVELWVAFAAWTVVFAAMGVHLVRTVLAAPAAVHASR